MTTECREKCEAAAPDLLAALQEVMENLGAARRAGSYDLPFSTVMMVNEAIAKATAEE